MTEIYDKNIEKQKEYRDYIIEVANKPDFPHKLENLTNLLEIYFKFCEKNNFIATNPQFNLALSKFFIIESEPLLFDVNLESVANVIEHLQEVQINNINDLVDGISEEEAKILLEWNIQNIRNNFINHKIDIKEASLDGLCTFSQSLTLNAFKEIGLEITVNDNTIFPNIYYFSHHFGTVKIPIKENGMVFYKVYLIDAAYRQFFTLLNCHKGLLTENRKPAAGYYVCQTENGKKFASELLKNGYIELTKENAKIYGLGFSLSFPHCTEDTIISCENLSADNYYNAIMNQQNELPLTKSVLEKLGYCLDIPNNNPKL